MVKMAIFDPLDLPKIDFTKNLRGKKISKLISRNFSNIFTELKPGWSAISVFVGLNASNEELGLKTQNTWAFTDNAIEGYEKYTELSVDEMQDAKIPLLFVSFPSTKDPNWNLHPGRKVS